MSDEKLEYIADRVGKIEDKVDNLTDSFNSFQLDSSVKIARLNIKSGIWGLMGGALTVSIGLLVVILKGYL